MAKKKKYNQIEMANELHISRPTLKKKLNESPFKDVKIDKTSYRRIYKYLSTNKTLENVNVAEIKRQKVEVKIKRKELYLETLNMIRIVRIDLELIIQRMQLLDEVDNEWLTLSKEKTKLIMSIDKLMHSLDKFEKNADTEEISEIQKFAEMFS